MHRARKHFGQHFLVDSQILQEIIEIIAPQKDEEFIEIGPGTGALTAFLLPAVKKLDVVEIDRDLVVELREKFKSNNLTIHQGDVLQFNFNNIQAPAKQQWRVVGNLPYNISTPLLFKLFEDLPKISDMHFLLQKEVVERLTAEVGSEHYGRLSLMSQYFCDNFSMLDVGPEAFKPPPKVNSAFIKMIPRRNSADVAKNFARMSLIIKEAFCYRRKTIHNALKKWVSTATLQRLGINPQARPQELTLAEYIKISDTIEVQ